ncbi:MAG: hypothetical protein WBA43_15710 [Elainellaceae cyanobacterium]
MPLTCHQLITLHPQAWDSATVHPFLDQCANSTIQTQQFNTWLVQDYLFVVDFTRMAARLLAIAPVEHYDVLLSGMIALKDELQWFRAKAQERRLELDVRPQATCTEYCAYMGSLADAPYAVQATAFWAIELAYNQGWQKPGAMDAPYAEFAERWGNPGFTAYVQQLEQQADQALATAPDLAQQQAESAFLKITRLERDFWQMAFNAA